MKLQDDIYKQQDMPIQPFVFSEQVAQVFPDMIQRSVPGYDLLCNTTGIIAARYSQAHSLLYDLGCSLGGATFAMRNMVNAEGCEIIAVDNSLPMLDKFKQLLDKSPDGLPVQIDCNDILASDIHNASIVSMNLVLQFIPIAERTQLIEKIYAGLLPDGCFILAEKIKFSDEEENNWHIDLHHQFKAANGYAETEIANKRAALDNVLITETYEQHKSRLIKAGFKQVYRVMQCFNFITIVAIK